MKELLNEVKQSVKSELERANEAHPLFHSPHEAYGVLAEELDEAKGVFGHIEVVFNKFFVYMCKANYGNANKYLGTIRAGAIECAAKMIQVAAMAQKAIDSMQ